MLPILLHANQPPDRFYIGGPLISSFRRHPKQSDYLSPPRPGPAGRKFSLSQRLQIPLEPDPFPSSVPAGPPREPEDWIASTTTCRGHSTLGLSTLPDGTLLKDAIAADPQSWLGAAHIQKFGVDTKLLVKLLDAGQRLPVHAHPHVSWARTHLGASHGKAEAWYILTSGVVHLGLKRDVSPEEMLKLIESQDTETLLGLTHAVPVDPHETVYIPPGLLHAIGEGILLAEVQEPEDMSVLLEWKGFEIDGAKEGHLGVGWDKALTAVELKGRRREEVECLVGGGRRAEGEVLVTDHVHQHGETKQACGEYFRLEAFKVESVLPELAEDSEDDDEMEGLDEAHGNKRVEAGFGVLIVLDGLVEIVTQGGKGEVVRAPAGSTAVVPFAAGELVLRGSGRCVFARPPRV